MRMLLALFTVLLLAPIGLAQADSTNSAPAKPWAPPVVMPAHPGWIWTTVEGDIYDDVVVTRIEPETVWITHSKGVAHIPMRSLPPDIQKELGYDPAAAKAARLEKDREQAHPYYTMTSLADAQKAARQMHWPIAWMCGHLSVLSTIDPPTGSEDELTQTALNYLKPRAIVIFLDGNTDLQKLPPVILNQQFFQFDDGPVPGGHHFFAPKIVFSNVDMTKAFGRVSHTQLTASGTAAIDFVLKSIPADFSPQMSPASSSIASLPPAAATNAPAVTPAPVLPVPHQAAMSPSEPPAASAPAPSTYKPWAPPAVMPAHPNWTWTTSDGQTFQNVVVTKITPDTVSISHSTGVAHVLIVLLPPDIQKELNYDPRASAQLDALIDGKLISGDGTAASTPGPVVRYYAIYYSAQWCPPCHTFSPLLVKWYNAFKPKHPEFELIFVSEDHNEAAMLDYMKEMTMPWPAVRFSDLKHDGRGTFKGSGIEKFAGNGIPDLVFVDGDGKVLSDSYQGSTYVGPGAVINDINRIIGGASPVLIQE